MHVFINWEYSNEYLDALNIFCVLGCFGDNGFPYVLYKLPDSPVYYICSVFYTSATS